MVKYYGVEARQLVSQLKETAKSQTNPVNNQLIAASLKPLNNNPAIQLSLPSRAALTRTLNRNKMQGLLEVISSTDRHFDIPDKYLPFCLHDSGKEDSERFLILGDMENLNALRTHSKVWLCDGFFEICPSQFYQLYRVHIQIGSFCPPVFTFCLAAKKSPLTKGFLKP